MSETKIKINDIEEFCKLFRINIPVKEDFEYYIETLKKSNEFSDSLSDVTMSKFSEFEKWLSDNALNVYKYKMHCLDVIKNYIIETQAYKTLIDSPLSKEKIESRDWTNNVDDHQVLVSLDFKSANYSVLKTLDLNDELKNNWIELCKHLDIHEVLANSKSFRQLVFGNTNPKRLQTLQHQKIIQVLDYLKTKCDFKDEDFVFISHDELIFKVKSPDAISFFFDYHLKLVSELVNMPIRCTIFSSKKIKKNVFIKTFFIISDYFYVEKYKSLHGVPGNKFYMYFKQYILEKEFDEKDLVYFNDGELCKWVVQDEKPKKVQLPHYEKPEYVISIEGAKASYSHVWNQMTELLPNLSNEEKRRIIEIMINTCNSCYQAPAGCQCWNDI